MEIFYMVVGVVIALIAAGMTGWFVAPSIRGVGSKPTLTGLVFCFVAVANGWRRLS